MITLTLHVAKEDSSLCFEFLTPLLCTAFSFIACKFDECVFYQTGLIFLVNVYDMLVLGIVKNLISLNEDNVALGFQYSKNHAYGIVDHQHVQVEKTL